MGGLTAAAGTSNSDHSEHRRNYCYYRGDFLANLGVGTKILA
jgi:hypothetical protein